MSDMADAFKRDRERKKQKKAERHEQNMKVLRRSAEQESDVRIVESGDHVIVTVGLQSAQFWPSTGTTHFCQQKKEVEPHRYNARQLILTLRALK